MSMLTKPKRRVLELKTPTITSYPTHAHTLSCVLNNGESIQWFLETYIQLFGRKDVSSFCYVDFFAPIPWKACPWIYYQRVSGELIRKGWDSIVDFLIDSIDLGCYGFLYLNRFYLSESWAYQRVNDMHDIFVYGYDKNQKVFYIADFNGKSRYDKMKVSFAEIEKAYSEVELSAIDDFLQGVIMMNPIQNKDYSISIKRMKGFLNDFLLSQAGTYGYSDGYRQDVEQNIHQFCFGMGVYHLLQNYLEFLLQGKTKEDIRGFHVLYDHKTLMLKRVEFLGEYGYIDKVKPIYDSCNEIRNQTLVLRNLVLKGFISEDKKYFLNAINLIPGIQEMEQDVLYNIIKNI